ncbi:hypothetical protein STCU_02317 [Strigomonas culicis]|uniref:Uncharacterized protein n=1 Tax=Strigomonas culicis TaxID=28005 RepID=S9W1E6_9TRYP|nr:hypothetical protein STCU_02317 [Strigomonas culicis]|eukprot:EPY33311.1 hypothetical protein STCU_02317 [Strigomonas culicis]
MPTKKREEEKEGHDISCLYPDGSLYEGKATIKKDALAADGTVNPLGATAASQATSTKGAPAAPVPPDGAFMYTRHGQGRFVDASGCVYEGRWREGEPGGAGTLLFPSGCEYTGEFVDNRFHGAGKYVWPDGSFYEGQWENNRMHGAGMYVDTTGKCWHGTFADGKGVDLRPEIVL